MLERFIKTVSGFIKLMEQIYYTLMDFMQAGVDFSDEG